MVHVWSSVDQLQQNNSNYTEFVLKMKWLVTMRKWHIAINCIFFDRLIIVLIIFPHLSYQKVVTSVQKKYVIAKYRILAIYHCYVMLIAKCSVRSILLKLCWTVTHVNSCSNISAVKCHKWSQETIRNARHFKQQFSSQVVFKRQLRVTQVLSNILETCP